MKLTKKQEAQIRKIYEAFWESYINGDLETYASLLAEDFKFIGSTEAEPLLNKKDSIKFLEATAEQLRGKAEFRNRNIKVETVDDLILITELCDGYILIGSKWNFYSRFRLSSLLKKKKERWKFIHQHVSMPDSKAQEGESFALEQIRTENIQLRDAVKRRTVELENKNRELEIESAVERVRAKALAMHRSEEISSVANVLRTELVSLNIPGIAAATITLQQENGEIRLWDITSVIELKDGFHFAMDILFSLEDTKPNDWIRRIWDSKEKYFVYKQDKKDFKRTLEWTAKYDSAFVENARLFLERNNIKTTWHPVVPLSHGKLSLDLLQEPVAEVESILTKMAAAFDLAYKRFLDLQKAEAQTREAQIEVSLERVRARTMAMQRSDELMETAVVLFDQLNQLGENIERTIIGVMNEEERVVDVWATRPDGSQMEKMQKFPIDEPILMQKVYGAWRQQKKSIVIDLQGEELESYFQFLKRRSLRLKRESFGERRVENFVFFSKGMLGVINADANTPADIGLYERFAAVFEQTYTRFLDLQKAEAQAREAQIELALERVRARTMAMQKSDELREAVLVIYEQLQQLNFNSKACNIIIIDNETNNAQYWVSGFSKEIFPESYTVPYLNHPYQDALLNPWKQGDKYVVYEYAGKMKQNFDEIFFTQTDFRNVPAEAKKVMIGLKSVMLSTAFMTYGALQSLGAQPLSDENANILHRFAKVFEQTYTRFLDLQKAEAQTREAKIEAALERTRTQSMLMQHSDEIMNVSNIFHEQLLLLGIPSEFSYVWLPDETKQEHQFWATWAEEEKGITICKNKAITYPLDKTEPYTAACFTAWQSDEPVFIAHIAPAEVKNYFSTWEELLRDAKKMRPEFFTEGLYYAEAYMKYGCFGFNIRRLLSEDEQEILRRFTVEFERTYTRFLDLQKAEAQAREAQIEAALERVRSRTMGMQKSDELKEVIQVVYEQFVHLNIHVEHTGFIMDYKTRDDMHIWLADKHAVPFQVTIPYFDCAHWNSFNEAKEKGIDFFANQLSFEEKNKFYQDLFKLIPGVPEETLEYYFSCPGLAISTVLLENVGLYIENFSGIPYTGEENNTLMRFGKVFQQTYTRFLDLQKAEAQAREAKIETGLERVRSRSLAMHNTSELQEVIHTVHKELLNLGIAINGGSFIAINSDIDTTLSCWGSGGTADTSEEVHIPLYEKPFCTNLIKGIKKGPGFFTEEYTQQEKKEFFTFLFKHEPWSKLDAKQKKKTLSSPGGYTRSCCVSKHTSIFIINHFGEKFSAAENDILQRFGKVFEQTYTRFLDLQKAEAQAREAQIEAALEKVRSRSLAMHTTSELGEVVTVIVEKLKDLRVVLDANGVVLCTYFPDSKDVLHWIASPDFSFAGSYLLPYFDHPIFNAAWESKESGADYFSKAFSIDEKNSFFEYAFEHSDYKLFPDDFKQWVFQNDKHILSFAWQKNSAILIPSHTGVLLSTDDVAILKRFAKVFEQAYTRFLDLKKAEAQAREATIETALERVRSKSMAMHSSNELKDVITIVIQQFKHLGFNLDLANFNYINNNNRDWIMWLATPDKAYPEMIHLPYIKHPLFDTPIDAFKKGLDFISDTLTKEEKDSAMQHMYETSVLKKYDTEERIKYVFEGKGLARSVVFMKQIILTISNLNGIPYTDEQNSILKRFANVFEQSYTRFLDLQKAEAQAREAQIEVSLERVRSKAMAMHKTEDLTSAVSVVFDELDKLQLGMLRCGIGILHREKRTADVWTTAKSEAGTSIQTSGDEPMDIHPLLQGDFDAWLRQEDFSYILEGKDLENYYQVLTETNFQLPESASFETIKKDHKQYYYVTPFELGTFFAFREAEFTPEAKLVMKRFANVFNLTYKRFLDLQKAEAQAREGQIELGLERVRARAMAMQKSDELSELVDTVFKELTKLDFALTWCIINIIDESSLSNTVWAANPDINKPPESYHMLFEDYPFHHAMMKGWKERQTKYLYTIEGQEKKIYDEYLFNKTEFRRVPAAAQAASRAMEKYVVTFSFSNFGGLQTVGDVPLSDANLDILSRFGKVFDLTYTRFNDLKQAEAQARESQIQLALERVRARTMAMQKSYELAEAASLLFTQIADLGTNSWSSGFIIFQPDELSINSWMSKPDGSMGVPFNIPVTEDPFFIKIYEAYKRGEEFFVMETSGKELEETYKYMFSLPGAAKALGAIEDLGFQMPTFQITHCVFFPTGFLMFITHEPCQEMWEIFRRFGKVFEQTYTRFLDLQKAEAQAREAQIEAALERVRSRAMAMHKTDELLDAAELVSKELSALGITSMNVSYAFVDEEEKYASYYSVNPVDGKVLSFPFVFPHTETDVMRSILSSWKKQEPFNLIELDEEATLKHQTYIGEHIQNLIIKNNSGIPFSVEAFLAISPKKAVIYTFNFTKGYLFNIGGERLTTMQEEMVMRFTKVFDMTYRRFLDLKQAEAQAREAQIQLAMERVRARTMAMQKSDELPEAANLLFQQVQSLGMPAWSAGYCTWDNDKKTSITLSMSSEGVLQPTLSMPLTKDPSLMHFREAWERGESFFVEEVGGEELKRHYTYLRTLPGVKETLDDIEAAGFPVPTFQIFHLAFFSKGFLLFITYEPVPEAHNIFKRFAKVFEQTYTRFLDLQKAEAQTREARIENALEKVRSRTMAMQRSAELAEVATVLFQQVKALGVPQWTCGFSIFEIDDKEFTWYPGSPDGEILTPCKMPLMEHPVFISMNESRKRGDELFIYEKEGELQAGHYRYMQSLPGARELLQNMLDAGLQIPTFQIDHLANFSHGNLIFITYEHFPEMHDIFKRFAKVFDQTYTRFLDLQKAEVQAREAIKQASVDRIRAEIASMRTTNDLERIQPIIWNELTTLGVPFTRCGVFIMDEEHQQVHTFLSTPDGRSIASFTSAYSNLAIITEALPYWRRKEIYKAHWDEATFLAQAKTLLAQGNITSTETYLTEHRPKDLYLHFLPFLQGILYVGNETPLNDDELQLVQNLADAFSIAYARYEDFNKLELAKEQIENTLVDLKQTQAQLVQSEKMASLGELTAGIAHEIQNPLNFVNNFSDVNKELLVEMKDEIEKGNIEEVKAIANDIIGNEEKINHHGKRADAIVKGMLQHSRSSSGVKEPADINVLADEYLRLAYHGLRAKDKFFNATVKTEFDESVGKINIVPQDIGRSVLNLITNAFYAVAEKKKQNAEGYEPTVTVTTKRINGRIEIRVADNGNGIPQKVLDKIFQPFFTTKPTGQGTGLGLSLSYDIIRAHGGEINVETKEGEGSDFFIFLPANN